MCTSYVRILLFLHVFLHSFEESVNQALAAYSINSELTRVKVEVGLEMDAVVSILSVAANVRICMCGAAVLYIVYVYSMCCIYVLQ